jgi:hypothetical protein
MTRAAIALLAGLAVLGGTAAAQSPDTLRAGRFDAGKMWTFEYPPAGVLLRDVRLRGGVRAVDDHAIYSIDRD